MSNEQHEKREEHALTRHEPASAIAPENLTNAPITAHVRGEWEVVRVAGVTVAQGYKCSCGVIGCVTGARWPMWTHEDISLKHDMLKELKATPHDPECHPSEGKHSERCLRLRALIARAEL